MGGELAVKQKGELVVPRVELSDILVLSSAMHRGLSERMALHIKNYEEALKNAVNGAVDRTRVKMGIFSRPKEYDYIGESFFDYSGKGNKTRDELIETFLPEEVRAMSKPETSVKKVYERLEEISREIDIFLRYFFLTPVNEASWERFLSEIIPVEEKTSLLIYSSTRVSPFKRELHEKAKGRIENMQIIPSVMAEEHIDFYVFKILEAIQNYNLELKKAACLVSKFRDDDMPVPEHLVMDIKIMNHCLENIAQKPYSLRTGAYAVQLRTAASRVGGEIGKITESLYTMASRFLSENMWVSFKNMACRQGFLFYKSKKGEFALRKV